MNAPFRLKYKINHPNKAEAVEFLKSLPDGYASLVIHDPQYRHIADYLKHGNEGARQKERFKLQQMSDAAIVEQGREIVRVLQPSGHCALWMDKIILCQHEPLHFFKDEAGETQMQIVDLVTWNKGTFGMGYRTRKCCEYLMILQKRPLRAKGVWTDHGIRDVWEEKIDDKKHVHQKPFSLQKRIIQAVTKPGDVVIDVAAGSFKVMEAAIECGRVFMGCDIEGAKFLGAHNVKGKPSGNKGRHHST